jgi:hypothetical protein
MSEGPWQCEVALRFIFGNDGERLPHVLHMPFGDIITDPSRVEERLRRAQIAILNPSIGRPDFPSAFLAQPIADYGHTISFSRNYISMDIHGPGVADLSFVDLPGNCQLILWVDLGSFSLSPFRISRRHYCKRCR